MQRRDPKTYPDRDLTPEHTKRSTPEPEPLHDDVTAAYRYVEKVRDTSDYSDALAWHGWAIREAFLAGITHQQEKKA